MKNLSNYPTAITRNHPATLIFLLDQSGSMKQQINFDGFHQPKSQALAITINTMISEILNRCKREDGYRDYFKIAILGYSDNEVYSLLGSEIALKTTSEIYNMSTPKFSYNAQRIFPDGSQSTVTLNSRMWVKAHAEGQTPMFKALNKAYDIARIQVSDVDRDSFPPIIFNITDGEVSDASNEELKTLATKISALKTLKGNVLLCNMHICSDENAVSVLFPSTSDEISNNQYAHLLYDISSIMPDYYNKNIAELKGFSANSEFRAMSFNATMTDLLQMLTIGTISTLNY